MRTIGAMVLLQAMMVPLLAHGQAGLAAPIRSAAPLFDPVSGYRIDSYRGVVGAPPEGVARVDAAQVQRLIRSGAILIDVNPAPGARWDERTKRLILAEPHASISRAHWFPESGRGRLGPGIEPWFLAGVRRLAQHHPHRPVVVFCQADCWMSWNATLRLHRAGVGNLLWFGDGLDGWKDRGLPVRAVRPEPR